MTKESMQALTRILGWSSIFGLVVLALWFGGYMAGVVCGTHSQMFDLTPHECSLLSYGGMGLLKILVLTLFVFPWLALRPEIRRLR